ncbi:hypothetical protein Tco_0687078, partial [Tanacetum coccineum]
DEVVQDQRQRDDNDLQDDRQDQPKEEEVEPTATLDGTRIEVCSDVLRFQLIPSRSSTLLLSPERSTSMVPMICRLSSHLVSLRTTKAFVPALLRCSACNLTINIPKWICWRPESNVGILCALQHFYCLNKVLLLGQGLLAFLLIVLAEMQKGKNREIVGPDFVSFMVENEPTSYRKAVTSSE